MREEAFWALVPWFSAWSGTCAFVFLSGKWCQCLPMAGPFLTSESLCPGSHSWCALGEDQLLPPAWWELSFNPHLVKEGEKQIHLSIKCCWPLVISRDSAEKVATPPCHLWIWRSGSAKLIAINTFNNSRRCYPSMFWPQWPVLTVTILQTCPNGVLFSPYRSIWHVEAPLSSMGLPLWTASI